MEFYDNSNSLVIKQTESIADALSEYSEIETLTIRSCQGTVEVDLLLNNYPNLKEVELSSDGDAIYQLGSSFSQLIHVTSIISFSTIDITQLPSMPTLQNFSVVIEKWPGAVESIYQGFPALTSLTLWSSENKTFQVLSPVIQNFTRLKTLFLRQCMFKALPLANMPTLKSLTIANSARNLPFSPDIGDLTQLESLEYSCYLPSEPTELAKLTQLTSLSLSYALDADETPEYLDILSKLDNLQELDLSNCEIENVDFINNKKLISTLNLESAQLTDLTCLKEFINLESLILEDTDSLETLAGIEKLPIKYLDISNSEVEDISALSSISSLEYLNIKQCDEIQDLSPLIQLKDSVEVVLSDRQVKKLEQAKSLAKLPNLNVIITSLNNCDLTTFETAITQLFTLASASKQRRNKLCEYFSIEFKEDKRIKIPLLDGAFSQFSSELSNSSISQMLAISLLNIGEDNFNVTLLALDELLKRNNEDLEVTFVDTFKKSCDRYDFGHRAFSNTVQDKIIDYYLPQFSTPALINVLKIQHDDFLNSDTGEQADALYTYAFAKSTKRTELDELWQVLNKYYDEGKAYREKSYFDELYQTIADASENNKFSKDINQKCQALINAKDYYQLLNESDPDIIEATLASMNVKDNEEFLQEHIYEVFQVMYFSDINRDAALDFFKSLMLFDWSSFNGAVEFIEHYFKNQPANIITLFLESITREGNQVAIANISQYLALSLGIKSNDLLAITPYMEFIEKLTGTSRNDSIGALISSIYPFISNIDRNDNRVNPLAFLDTLKSEFKE